MIIEALEKFLEIGHEPDDRLIKKLSLSKNMDDQLYVLLHKNFKRFGLLRRKQRQFEQPKVGFGAREHGIMYPNYKQRNMKKRMGKKEYSRKDRKGFRIL
jgi:hypothetical protein